MPFGNDEEARAKLREHSSARRKLDERVDDLVSQMQTLKVELHYNQRLLWVVLALSGFGATIEGSDLLQRPNVGQSIERPQLSTPAASESRKTNGIGYGAAGGGQQQNGQNASPDE